MNDYKTCNHLHDTGERCNSAAAVNRDYCVIHLRHRARQLRIAQARARNERFDLKLPPIESMSAVLSALNQIVEAVAADMIDLKRADFLLKSLRFAAQALKTSDKWQASVYHTDAPAPAVNLQSEYGLPEDTDLDTPPEVAFPPPPESVQMGAPPLSPAFGDRVGDVGCPIPLSFGGVGPVHGGSILPSLDRTPLIPEIPAPGVRDYTAEGIFIEATPEDMELNEILKEQGYKAFDRRAREHQRNSARRKQRQHFRANYQRYVAEAKATNIQRAAEQLIKEKLAAEKAAAQNTNATPDTAGCPIPPSVGGVGTFSDTTRKPVASFDAEPGDTSAAHKEEAIA
jgi:hypothetical protein